ncbi:Rso55p Ecym_3111 [Eremothecium cymbalariae DBVPG|uniref:Prokaryotic-type class I peptide chain release factors domain-containing protein n=1 Tax=Eremothecium cymbalariae (strain CBS 270.75 / DBVPG 7215 / KCTC 17166 / NRRL Y-17582) TaxID=931890 RepID=G8JR50_ERECY|nr:Hypothetical protein Ecym_3111 [Eremothecium cymbalariae DBVPG\
MKNTMVRLLRNITTTPSQRLPLPTVTLLSVRPLHETARIAIKKNKLPPRPRWAPAFEQEVEETFLHGGRGPGGQKINKCNSKVQLKHLPSGIVVECQETRSRENNRKLARQKLAAKIAIWNNGDKALERDLALQQWVAQGKRSKHKKSRQKHEQAKLDSLEDKRNRLLEEETLIRSILSSNCDETK